MIVRDVACKDIFAALPWREELEYHLESDSPMDPYVAPARSRFDDPEFVALFADILRRMATNQSVSAALRSEGFEQNERAVASMSSYGYFFVAWADIPKRFPSQLCQFQLRKYGITARLADQTIVIYQILSRCELGLLIRYWFFQVCRHIEI